jgi:hypothetical protein
LNKSKVKDKLEKMEITMYQKVALQDDDQREGGVWYLTHSSRAVRRTLGLSELFWPNGRYPSGDLNLDGNSASVTVCMHPFFLLQVPPFPLPCNNHCSDMPHAHYLNPS